MGRGAGDQHPDAPKLLGPANEQLQPGFSWRNRIRRVWAGLEAVIGPDVHPGTLNRLSAEAPGYDRLGVPIRIGRRRARTEEYELRRGHLFQDALCC
jgi:hypothetical protein